MRLRPHKLAIVLAMAVAAIIGAHLATLVAGYGFGRDHVFGLTALLDVDRERNVPAFFSFALLLIAAGLLLRVAWKKPLGPKPRGAYWFGLACAFVYLASDEGFELHERVGQLTADLLGGGELAYYAWLLPYALVAISFGLTYARFLFQLPAGIRNQFVTAGIIYLGGAFGTEVLGGIYVHFNHTEHALGYDLLSATEETLEMLGVIWFINSLALLLKENGAPVPEHRSAVSQPEKSAST